MSGVSTSPEWYYVGHYGQLGPLTLEQMEELARDGVIDGETYVWRPGMANWTVAVNVPDLRQFIAQRAPAPPPMPGGFGSPTSASVPPAFQQPPSPSLAYPASHPASPVSMPYGTQNWNYLQSTLPVSDKSRLVAGLLNFIPGVGRFYLGYAAHGALQLFTGLFCGVGVIWSWIDGIIILSGGVKYDGYGRRLEDHSG